MQKAGGRSVHRLCLPSYESRVLAIGLPTEENSRRSRGEAREVQDNHARQVYYSEKKNPPPVTCTSPGTPTTAKRLPQILNRRDPPPPEPPHPYAEDGFMFS
jgi:hypothetical protein